jgi:hypothetical protein
MRRLVLFLVLAAGCLSPVDSSVAPVTERSGAVGEPTNGFPSAFERLGLMAINRARSDPATVKGPQSTIYPARPPVIWSLALNQSARFHATTLEIGDVTLMHSSPCTLKTDVGTSGCSGDPACACATAIPSSCAMCAQVAAENTCGTAWNTRVGYFTSGAGISITGEVAAAGYKDPMTTVDGWMDEAAGSDGHRTNLTDQGITSNTMGYGHATGTKECYSPFDVSDSGSIKGASIPKMPTAAVTPPSGNAGTFTFYATWADPSLGTPGSINVVLDGTCTAMSLELGTDKLNATYKATATLAAGCHTYYVVAVDASSARISYPTTGVYNIPVGSATCSADYVSTTTGADCDPGTATTGVAGANGQGGSSGATGSGGSIGSGGTTGAGGVSGTGGKGAGGSTGSGGAAATGSGGTTGSGGSPGSGGTTGSAGTTGSGGASGTRGTGGTGMNVPTKINGGCGCDVATPNLPSTTTELLLLGIVLLARRTSERRPARRRRP